MDFIEIQYIFRFNEQKHETVNLRLDAGNLEIVNKIVGELPSWAKLDFRWELGLPGFFRDDMFSAFIVIDNLTNLLNDDWGVLKQQFPGEFLKQNELSGRSCHEDY